MSHTKYANLTDDEFLNKLDDARSKSPTIEELAARLEKAKAIHETIEGDTRATCPVCEAELEITYDESNTLFSLEAR